MGHLNILLILVIISESNFIGRNKFVRHDCLTNFSHGVAFALSLHDASVMLVNFIMLLRMLDVSSSSSSLDVTFVVVNALLVVVAVHDDVLMVNSSLSKDLDSSE